ncbi:peptidase family m1 domain-containing protein [Ditylenchus destructor]|uniref:Peptidase family m1 domain-containing protein n=1 Tax=Ditylenchus destructor TaxID=166010 RepID=A0AAD4MR82_9BILA|nr:peptidase family m1 domain-containing protein [Ditylenchus destructor]
MENWALIIFDEMYFSFDEERDDFEQRKLVCNVVAHEISHHWFGDLVTMSHWRNLFLNEGFATLMGFDALAATVNSSVDPDAEFVRNRMPAAFEVDSAITSPPISYGNDTVPEGFVKEIVYNKGACVLRMFKYVLGGFDNFAESLGIYVNKFRYGNVEYMDLLRVLSESHRSLTNGSTTVDFMNFGLSWIEQPGFPVVSVVRLNTTHVHLSQKRFLRQEDEPESPPTFVFV